jgi:hypothetical protein
LNWKFRVIHYWVLRELGSMELRFCNKHYKFLQLLQTIFFLSDFEPFSSNQSIWETRVLFFICLIRRNCVNLSHWKNTMKISSEEAPICNIKS